MPVAASWAVVRTRKHLSVRERTGENGWCEGTTGATQPSKDGNPVICNMGDSRTLCEKTQTRDSKYGTASLTHRTKEAELTEADASF